MKSLILPFFIGVALLISACQKKEKRSLAEVEKQELAKGIRNDSLFLGLAFGMTAKEFYAVCWDLNKKGILREAVGNTAAAYQLNKGEMNYEAEMDFYPTYKNDKINEMPVRFHYKAWAPWNEHLQSNKLILEVQKLMEKWYGGGFFIASLPEGGKGIVKVEGNRKITITLIPESESEVLVTFTDLTNQ